ACIPALTPLAGPLNPHFPFAIPLQSCSKKRPQHVPTMISPRIGPGKAPRWRAPCHRLTWWPPWCASGIQKPDRLFLDSITQAALGAGIAGAMLGRRLGRKALIAGAVLGTLPDLDILIGYGDPLSQMINHRGFSHSVFVLTALSALLTWLVHRWRPRD